MSYDKRLSDKAINYLERVKRTGIENRQELDELSRQAYSDYREGIPSEKEYGSIYAQVKMALSNTIATFTAYDWSYVKKKYKLNMPFLRLAYPAKASAFSSNAA